MDDDGDDKDDSKRRTRNLSEKKRRDQFNVLVNELGSMVTSNNRKMDKSTVLKSTISFLKNHNEVTVRSRAHDINEEWKPAFLSNEEFTYLVLEALEGFVMVFSANGQICYASESITSLLGHNPTDVINKNVFDLIFEDDKPSLFNLLRNPATDIKPTQTLNLENEIRFQCHLQRGSYDYNGDVSYELVQFNGHFREYIGSNMEQGDTKEMARFSEHEAGMLFVCTGKLNTPQLIRDVTLLDSSRSEFTSRHSLEWKFLFLDHRAPPIIGYLPFEVLGTSGYDYYHFDDLDKVVSCHEALMQKGELTSCYYRFLTKGQQWIWLQTRFYITYHQWNSKPEFVVCTHRVVSYADIVKNAKQEGMALDTTTEVEVEVPLLMKDAPTDETTQLNVSPSYMSDASEAFGPYQPLSQPASVKSASAGSTSGTMLTTATAATASASASWPRASCARFAAGSDTASMSGESRSSQRNDHEAEPGIYTPYIPEIPVSNQHLENEMVSSGNGQYYSHVCEGGMVVYPHNPHKPVEACVPQHSGTQYLEPAPYVGTVPGMLPLTLPVIMSSDQAQVQEQLQRKHEELQHMIMRQQEELRQVKEQLLLARLGILQPIMNVPNQYPMEEMQQNPHLSIEFETVQQRPALHYPVPPHLTPYQLPHLSQHQSSCQTPHQANSHHTPQPTTHQVNPHQSPHQTNPHLTPYQLPHLSQHQSSCQTPHQANPHQANLHQCTHQANQHQASPQTSHQTPHQTPHPLPPPHPSLQTADQHTMQQ